MTKEKEKEKETNFGSIFFFNTRVDKKERLKEERVDKGEQKDVEKNVKACKGKRKELFGWRKRS